MLRLAILLGIAFGSIWMLATNPPRIHPDIIDGDASDRKIIETGESSYGIYAWSRSSISENLWNSGRNQGGVFSRPTLKESSRYLPLLNGKLDGPGLIPHSPYLQVFPIGLVGKVPLPTAPRILIIGLGSGAGIGSLIAHFPQSTTDIVDIDPMVIDMSRRNYPLLPALEKWQKATIHAAEGRQFVRNTLSKTYDLIIIDAFAGGTIPGHLLTVEFLQDCKRIMKPQGRLHANLISQVGVPNNLVAHTIGTLSSAGFHATAFRVFRPGISELPQERRNVAVLATRSDEAITGVEWERIKGFIPFASFPVNTWVSSYCAQMDQGHFASPLMPHTDACETPITIDPVLMARETWKKTLLQPLPHQASKPFTDAMPNADLFSH